MPSKRSTRKRSRGQDSQTELKGTPPPKKQTRFSTGGASVHDRKNNRELAQVIDLTPEAIAKQLLQRDKVDIPPFRTGTVCIQLSPNNDRYTFYLDKEKILQALPRFDYYFQRPPTESDIELASKVKADYGLEAFFELQYNKKLAIWTLVRVPFTKTQSPEKDQPRVFRTTQQRYGQKKMEEPGLTQPSKINQSHSGKRPEKMPVMLSNEKLSAIFGGTVVEYGSIRHSPFKLPRTLTFPNLQDAYTTREIPPKLDLSSRSPLAEKGIAESTSNVKVEVTESYEEEIIIPPILPSNEEIEDIVRANISTSTNISLIHQKEQDIESKATLIKETQDSILADIITTLVSAVVTENLESVKVNATAGVDNTIIPKEEGAEFKPIFKESKDSIIANSANSADIFVNTKASKPNGTDVQGSVTSVSTSMTKSFPISKQEIVPSTTQEFYAPKSDADEGNHTTTVAGLVQYACDEKLPQLSPESKESFPECEAIEKIPNAICDAYRNFLLFIHDMTPEIDSEDINNAMIQVEELLKIARLYRWLSKSRHYLSNHLLQFGRHLSRAILQDPPRWLLIAVNLESALIFKEAIIHIVGQYPHYPWLIAASKLPREITHLIHKKVEALKALKASIDGELFKSSIAVNGKELIFATLEKSNFDTWFVIQLWRDWFCHSQSKQELGLPYRLMARGGNAYLDTTTVYLSLIEAKGNGFVDWHLRAVEEDLSIMKDFASKIVKDLVVNHSMLDIEEVGIKHFTCIKVENEELPWIK